MDDRYIPVIAVVAIVVATVCFANKPTHQPEPIDQIKTALEDAVHITDPASDITLQLFNVDENVPYWVRYVMLPRYMAPPVFMNDTAVVMKKINGQQVQMYRIVKTLRYDTVLSICRANATDSIEHVITDKRKVLWQNKDNMYRYYLTTAHR